MTFSLPFINVISMLMERSVKEIMQKNGCCCRNMVKEKTLDSLKL